MPRADKNLMKYMGLGAQFFFSIAIALGIGWKLDKWLLPLLVILATLIKIIKETTKSKP
jgi:hypothetical protein